MDKLLKLRLKVLPNKDIKEVFHGSLLTFTSKVLAGLCGLGANLIVARYYGVEVMGITAIVYSIFMLSAHTCQLGMNISLSKFIPEYQAINNDPTSIILIYRKILSIVLVLTLCASLILFFSSRFIASRFFSKEHLGTFIAIASPFIFMQVLIQFNSGAIRALRRMKWYAIAQLSPFLLRFVILIPATLFFYQTYNPVYVNFIAISISALTTIYMVQKLFPRLEKKDSQLLNVSISKIVSVSFPMLLVTSTRLILPHIETIILGTLRSEGEVGIYSLLIRLSFLSAIIFFSVNSIVTPKISHLYHSRKLKELHEMIKRSTSMLFWASFPILLILVLFGKIILGIFGQEFTSGYTALILLIVGQLMYCVSGPVGHFLNMTGHHRVCRLIIVSSLSTTLILDYLLIPHLGIIGAALANMIGAGILNIIGSIVIKINFGFSFFYFPFLRPANRREK